MTVDREHELYTRFGEAALYAQMFEYGFAYLLSFRDGMADAINGKFVGLDASIAKWRSATAGRMAKSLRKEYGAILDNVMDLWDRAVSERNRLMHRFFIEHAPDTLSEVGMQRALEDADQLRDLFIEADRACVDVRDTTVRNMQDFARGAQ